MKTKHTQGQWSFSKSEMISGFKIWAGEDTKLIATVHTEDVETDEEAEANSHLIAAAPEILEVLEAIVNKFDTVRMVKASGIELELHLALSVISKAKGQYQRK